MFIMLGLPLLAGVLLLLWRRQQQRQLALLAEARQLERSADHVLHVAQTIQQYTGRADIAHALLSLVERFTTRAAQLAPREPRNEGLLERYHAIELRLRTQPEETVPEGLGAGAERELNHTRFLVLEANRLLGRLQQERLFDAADLKEMADLLQQTLRAVDLRLQLRAAMMGGEREMPRDPDSAQRQVSRASENPN
jgi:hypothetical protein